MTFFEMNNTLILKGLLTKLFVLASIFITTAQVQFKLTLLDDGETYQVSLIPDKSWRILPSETPNVSTELADEL